MIDVEKVYMYVRVDRRLLIEVAARWLKQELLRMVIGLISTLAATTKGDPADLTVQMMRGVPRGAPSSPVFFNMYINALESDVRTDVSAENCDVNTVTMVADDILIQVSSEKQTPSDTRLRNTLEKLPEGKFVTQ